MIEAEGKPTKGRRWWIAVVDFLSIVSWWYWPRGDSRFVGKWEVRIEDSTSQPARTVVLVLKANGSGETYANGRRGGDFAWRVQG